MGRQPARAYEMTPERFGVLYRAVKLIQESEDFFLYKVQACPGNRVAFSIVPKSILELGPVHPHDPAIIVGISESPEEAAAQALERGRLYLQRIQEPVSHPLFLGPKG